MGRATKLTPERQQRIVELIEAGNYQETACAAAGICTSTFHNWIARGQEGQEPLYVEFLEAVKSAEARAEEKAVAAVRSAFPDSWQAAMTYLERRYPRRWGRRDRHEVSGPDGGPIPLADAERLLDSSLSAGD